MPGEILVLAGVNGVGKSSIFGTFLESIGSDYFNPDHIAAGLQARDPSLRPSEANSIAWKLGRRLLEDAVANGLNHAFETTLGGTTITRLLKQADERSMKIRMVYVGLNSFELHRQRVEARANRGGHPIDEAIIRARLTRSMENLIRLLPVLHELRLYDNSNTVDIAANQPPAPELLLHLLDGRVVDGSDDIATIPDWAKPAIFAASKINQQ